ncbi:12463_t:CDS:2 [Rhizophagus irregularis]|nr:12463_t:CDS:2 [Rhizophagus irregularis]
MSSSSLEWNNTQSASPLTKEKKEMLSFIPLQIKRNAYFGKTLLGSCSLLEPGPSPERVPLEPTPSTSQEASLIVSTPETFPELFSRVKEPSRSRILRRTQPSKIPRHSAPKSISSPAKSSDDSDQRSVVAQSEASNQFELGGNIKKATVQGFYERNIRGILIH